MAAARNGRITLDLSVHTVRELLACVNVRARWYNRRGREVPHLTIVALKMLLEALQ